MTTDPLQAAPLMDAEIRTLRCLFATRRIDHGLDYECVTLGQALKLLATIDHLKSSAERAGVDKIDDGLREAVGLAKTVVGRLGNEFPTFAQACDRDKWQLAVALLSTINQRLQADTAHHDTSPAQARNIGTGVGATSLPSVGPASVVSAPAPGEVGELHDIVLDALTKGESTLGIARRLLRLGYRKSLPTAEVVDEKHAVEVALKIFDRETANGGEPRNIAAYVAHVAYFQGSQALHPTPTAPGEKQ